MMLSIYLTPTPFEFVAGLPGGVFSDFWKWNAKYKGQIDFGSVQFDK